MRQERTVQATIFEVFAGHEISCKLKAISQWLDWQSTLASLAAGDLRRHGVRETGRRGLQAEAVLHVRCSSNSGSCVTNSWPFILRIRHRSGPLPACHWSGRRTNRCCTRQSVRSGRRPGKRRQCKGRATAHCCGVPCVSDRWCGKLQCCRERRRYSGAIAGAWPKSSRERSSTAAARTTGAGSIVS